ncbi:MAG: peptidoglycan-binding protein [Hyphomicrobiales bacterium]|nr:peptidoglycan-binding protein [Hyphomicrobiales bacterium]
MLHDLGYGPGRDDGVIDAATRDAVRRFQRDTGLAVDGRVTPGLVDRLMRRLQPGGGETTVIGPAPPAGTN